MATYNYSIWIKDSEIQEIMESWGYQVKTVRKLLFGLFPEEKSMIRAYVHESALRTKLCWKNEQELTDIETRLSRFYSKIKDPNVSRGGTGFDLQQELSLVTPSEFISYYQNAVKDWLIWWRGKHKYYMNITFRLEIERRFKDHIKTLDGNDIIF